MRILWWFKHCSRSHTTKSREETANILLDALIKTGKITVEDAQALIETFHNDAFNAGVDFAEFD